MILTRAPPHADAISGVFPHLSKGKNVIFFLLFTNGKTYLCDFRV
jgi:hypothetical protein